MVDVIEAETNPGYYFHKPQKNTTKKKFSAKDLSVVSVFAILFIIIAALALTPSSVLKPLTSRADVQETTYTIESEWAFAQNLEDGKLSPDIIKSLKENHVLVGSIVDGTFTESSTGTLLKTEDGTIYTSDGFYEALNSDAPDMKLYTAFRNSIPSYAALYNDEHATKKFTAAGTNRNNYSSDTSTFESVGDSVIEKGSNINVDSTTRTLNEKNKYEYQSVAQDNTNNSNLDNLVNSLINSGSTDATRAKANTIITAANDRTSKQTAAIFMECLEKTEAGDGKDEVHDCMNWFTSAKTTTYIDKNGTEQKITGAPSEAPSIAAALTGSKIPDSAEYYANDYALTLTNNSTVAATKDFNNNILSAINNTITSFSSTIRGAITNFLATGAQKVEATILTPILPLLDTSVLNNSFANIEGIYGGQMLWKGLVNLQGDLAAGSIPSSEENTIAFSQLNNKIASLNKKYEQTTKNPLDITTSNTFLGSIYYSILPNLLKTSTIASTIQKSVASILPGAKAEDNFSYYTDFGTCESAVSISAACTKDGIISRTYDANLLTKNTLRGSEFQTFIEENTYLESGSRKIKDNSIVADFITLYGENRSPLGTFNINTVITKRNNSSFLPTLTDLTSSIDIFLNATDEEKAIATGAAFVNSSNNPYYEKYKYASIYVSFARTLAILRAADPIAYNNFPLFEGDTNPVIAYLEEYNTTHPQDNSFAGYLSSITGFTTTEINNYLQIANYNPSNTYNFVKQPVLKTPHFKTKSQESLLANIASYIIYSDLRGKVYTV